MRSTVRIVLLLILGPCAFAQPTISQVLNSYSYTLPGLPNYGIAQGSIFSIFGSTLAPTTTPLLAAPLKDTLNGVSVAVTVGGVTARPLLYYLSPTQINAVLPSNTPVGTGQIVVSSNGQDSAPAPIQVVPVAFGLATSWFVLASDLSGRQITTGRPARPGDYITIWGTGLGAIQGSDAVAPPVQDFATPIEVEVGGLPATVLYHGRGGYPGLDQINIQLPPAPPGCGVSVVVRSGDIVSNIGKLPMVTSGSTCSDGTTTTFPLTVQAGVGFKQGSVIIGHIVEKTDPLVSGGVTFLTGVDSLYENATATFRQDPALDAPLVSLSVGGSGTPGSCTVSSSVTPVVTTGQLAVGAAVQVQPTLLDAGPSLSVSDPVGVKTLAVQNGYYSGVLSQGTSSAPSFFPATGGTVTVHASGGSDIGSFDAPTTVAPLLQWTNRDSLANISRSQPLTITWQYGQPGSYVSITGTSSASSATAKVQATFSCTAPVEAGSFTVPASVLLALPTSVPVAPSNAIQTIGISRLTVEDTFVRAFGAPGLDLGILYFTISASRSVTFQ